MTEGVEIRSHTHTHTRKKNSKQNKMIWHIQFHDNVDETVSNTMYAEAKIKHKRRKQLIFAMNDRTNELTSQQTNYETD